jgi:sterol desaturase/sphingolipid hydroxylase (fatty acid hydroxylase superfamily)
VEILHIVAGTLRGLGSATLLGLFALFTAIALEHVGPMERYSWRERLPGILMNAVSGPLQLVLVLPLTWLWGKLGIAPLLVVPLWHWLEPLGTAGYLTQIVVLVVIADFLAYWRHRAEHAWLWRIHVVHHAPRELHAANSLGHPVQNIFNFAFIVVPMSLFQIDGPGTPFMVGAILILAALYIHSPVEWHFGPLRRLIVDNRFHRIHHSLEPRHFDKNFGILLSIWDHLFGTAYEPGEEWPEVGVAGVEPPRTVMQFLSLPLRVGRTEAPTSSNAAASKLADKLHPSVAGLPE